MASFDLNVGFDSLFVAGFYLLIVLVASLVSYCFYGWDKRQARLKRWRVPEKTLHGLAMLGGWPGALLGQRHFRHKTHKRSFQITFWITVFVHCVVAGWIIYAALKAPESPVLGLLR